MLRALHTSTKKTLEKHRVAKNFSHTNKKNKNSELFPFAIANRITTFSTLRSCNPEKKTPKHGQHMLFAKLSDFSCVFKLLINY